MREDIQPKQVAQQEKVLTVEFKLSIIMI